MEEFIDDFIEDHYFDGDLHSVFDVDVNPLKDCNLDDRDLKAFLSPSIQEWSDYSSTNNPTFVTFNQAKKKQWKLAKYEIRHVRERIQALLSIEHSTNVTLQKIALHILGPKSDVGKYLCHELTITEVEYLRFISTMCVQAAYRVSATELYDPESNLDVSKLMEKKKYLAIWKCMSEKKKIPSSSISSSRRESPIWMAIEDITNKLCQQISINQREGEIPIALDDDKVWLALMNCKVDDLFNVKYTTHAQANRKGFIVHTAVSTGANVPLGVVVEKQFDSSLLCLKRLLTTQFQFDEGSRDGNALRNCTLHSDRGYMLPNIVFEFLLSNGAHALGTTKRLGKCWPFTFNQRMSANDKRTSIDPKGAPTLFMKECTSDRNSRKKMFATAFRNGTDKVATAISSLHSQHQWEAIIQHNYELREYENDQTSLISKFFQRVDNLFENPCNYEEEEVIESILEDKIVPITLRQGKTATFE